MNVLDLIEDLKRFPENSDVVIVVEDMYCLVGRVVDLGNGYLEISPECGSDRGLQPVGVELLEEDES